VSSLKSLPCAAIFQEAAASVQSKLIGNSIDSLYVEGVDNTCVNHQVQLGLETACAAQWFVSRLTDGASDLSLLFRGSKGKPAVKKTSLWNSSCLRVINRVKNLAPIIFG